MYKWVCMCMWVYMLVYVHVSVYVILWDIGTEEEIINYIYDKSSTELHKMLVEIVLYGHDSITICMQ